MLLLKIVLYVGCAIPSLLFYLCTEKYQQYTSNIVLMFITVIQLLIPIFYDGAGYLADNAILTVLSVSLGAGMTFYIRDLRRCGDNQEKRQQLTAFYHVLDRWNENPTRSFNNNNNDTGEVSSNSDCTTTTTISSTKTTTFDDQKPVSLSVIQYDSRRWFLESVIYMALSVPVMSFFDGLLRVCALPPGTDTISYWHRFPPTWQTLAYHLMTGFTLHLHVGIVELIYRFFLTTRLMMMMLWTTSVTSLLRYYDDTHHFILQPSLFDQPWLAHSAYNLWSCRWHQIFRPGFKKLAYDPVRSLFPEKKANKTPSMGVWMGRIAGTMAVFLASGLLHDYILLAMIGHSAIQSYPGMLGQQTIFFLLQGVATVISSPNMPWSNFSSRILPMWLARLLTWVWIIYTAPIFVDPFLRIGLHVEAEVPLYPRSFDPHIGFLCPYGTINAQTN
ncbi:membrane bound O-acyl transferase family-domain-containing protein [Halteromyces radiatus]|uniref:membrane bound O-acyl transferase family-domain-containing protein n=1 Tax=Halteromyces radiatus TaxID=101107 RepID=UPI00221FF18E|nr:membrane bound O-acyl transferase family-domain-containing protein [Halteromyces radiatus]KAI8082700.1 membrane bound O-acyl transferase family-domain-containing protein [Halteromyces radiatus]